MAGDLIAKVQGNEEYRIDMDEHLFQSIVRHFVTLDKEVIRAKASKSKNFNDFIKSTRFLVEYAKLSGDTDRLPPVEYLEKMASANSEFHHKKNTYDMNLMDIAFDKTRHGYGIHDFPFDANHGVTAVQDDGGCVAPCELRRIFVLENMNVPVCRFDPVIFTQTWILTLLRPKFVFRGMVACPKGDYGLARMIVEIGNSKGSTVRSEVSIAFKKGDDEKLGRFIPFEIASPDYAFRPTHVFFFVCIFYVNRNQMPIRGMRVANCTVQCVLPPMPASLEGVECYESFPSGSYDTPPHMCNYTIDNQDDPKYLRELKAEFFSTLHAAKSIRSAEVSRAEQDMNRLLAGNLLEDKMDVQELEEDDVTDKRKRAIGEDQEDEPMAKKNRQ